MGERKSVAEPETDELLRYYWQELTYVRKMGEIFARRHPKVASHLDLRAHHAPGTQPSIDPHVERLIEAFAFLTGRVQRNIDEDFPEIAVELLNCLYPHYLNPIPSTSVARFDLDTQSGRLTSSYTVPKNSPLFTRSTDGAYCRFRTSYPVILWPLAVTEAAFEPPDLFDFLDSGRVATVLRLRVASQAGPLSELDFDRLRFYLDDDQLVVQTLYEFLFCNVERIVVLPDREKTPFDLPRESITPVGFSEDEDLLPQPAYAHAAFRLVQEYFVFREKFHFFDIQNLHRRGASERSFDLLICFDSVPAARLAVSTSTFVLGCTPIINLFPKTTDPIRIDHRQSEYRLVPDAHREKTTEIHSILSVSSSSDTQDHTQTLQPFYSFTHEIAEADHKAFWHARRVPTDRPDLPGTDILLSFLNLDFKPHLPPTEVVYAHTLSTNRSLAHQIPGGAELQTDVGAPVSRIVCLRRPTRQVHPPLEGAALWRLISHLSLNYLSLTEGEESLRALKEILRLYSFYETRSAHDQIRGIREMSHRRVVRRVGEEAWRGFCSGTEITLVFDESLYVGTGAFVLASVLNHFFALYASTNSFTQLKIESQQRKGVWKQWPPMVGERVVL